ncbi:MAG: hypothetical protein LAO09_07480 [Acidobacteriia bacterium]|nr:hypothetical protein [Terriglobia bacterium]
MCSMMRTLVAQLDLQQELRLSALDLNGRPLAWSLGFRTPTTSRPSTWMLKSTRLAKCCSITSCHMRRLERNQCRSPFSFPASSDEKYLTYSIPLRRLRGQGCETDCFLVLHLVTQNRDGCPCAV